MIVQIAILNAVIGREPARASTVDAIPIVPERSVMTLPRSPTF